MKKYTWEQLFEAQEFNHGQVFVRIEDHNDAVEQLQFEMSVLELKLELEKARGNNEE
jgi:hypothetical protein